MNSELITIALRYAEAFSDKDGVARTPLPGVSIIRQTMPTPLVYAISSPLVALVLQGRKRVTTGSKTFEFGAGQSLLIGANVPNSSQIIHASLVKPYVSLIIDLNTAIIKGLMTEIEVRPIGNTAAIRIDDSSDEVVDTSLRLLRLLGRPASRHILADQLMRELHYWLLIGQHGDAIQGLGMPDSQAHHIARVVDILREKFAKKLRVEDLAAIAGMSLSSFHAHFRANTSLSPLQFQKQLRLIEARRLLLEGTAIANAAHDVGYESVPQFTREYSRFFGTSPGRDMKAARSNDQAA